MYAVVDIAGQQFKVEEKAKYFVPRLDAEINKAITFDNVLLFSDGKTTTIGTPSVKGMKVKAKVLEHLKDDKVIVFKKKRRKSYRVKNGHRQQLSQIEITKISKSAVKKAAAKTEEAPKEKKATTEKNVATAKKATAAKKVTPKTEAKPKAASKKSETSKDKGDK